MAAGTETTTLPTLHRCLSPRASYIAGSRRLLQPYEFDCPLVNLGDDHDWHARVVSRAPVDPISSRSIAVHIEHLDQTCRRAPALDEFLDLGARHCIAFDRGGVVYVVDPDLAQNRIGLDGPRKAAHTGFQERATSSSRSCKTC
jgi:hypothetical protein